MNALVQLSSGWVVFYFSDWLMFFEVGSCFRSNMLARCTAGWIVLFPNGTDRIIVSM